MARYTDPQPRSRAVCVDLVGEDKAFEVVPHPPGQHGRARIKETEYLLQLQEKQKARFTYGVMEKQFRRYYEGRTVAVRQDRRKPARILETPDNVVYRAGPPAPVARPVSWSATATSPSTVSRSTSPATVSQYDIIDVRPKSLNRPCCSRSPRRSRVTARPAWLQVVPSTLRILVHLCLSVP